MHYCLFVIARADDLVRGPEEYVESVMRPYREYDAGMEDLPWVVFVDDTENAMMLYNTGKTNHVIRNTATGEIKWLWDFKNHRHNILRPDNGEPEYLIPKGWTQGEAFYPEIYSTFEEFCKEYHGHEQVNGKWGYYMNPEGFWDWYRLGGRWTGALTGYEPWNDPRNKEVCWLCEGTGMRNDHAGQKHRKIDPSYTCNGCQGTGIKLKYEGDWAKHPGDIHKISTLDVDSIRLPYALMLPDGQYVAKETYIHSEDVSLRGHFEEFPFWKAWARAAIKANSENYIVVVDYHN